MTKPRTKPGPTPLEKMRELTRRLVQVPKAEIAKAPKDRKRKKRNH